MTADVAGRAADEFVPPPVTRRRTLSLLRAHMTPISKVMTFGIAFLLVGSLAGLLQPLATGRLLEVLDDSDHLRIAVIALLVVLVVTLLSNFFGSLLLLRATEGVVTGARNRLVRRVLSLSVPTMHRQNPGELTTRITSDSSMIRVVALTCVAQLVTGTISIVGSLIVMVWLNPLLLVVTLAFLVLPGTALLFTVPKVKVWSKRTQVAMGMFGRELERVFGMLTTVKANGAEAQESEDLERRIVEVRDQGNRASFWRSLNTTLSLGMVQVSYLTVLAVGGVMVQRGRMTVPELVTFLMYAAQLSAPVIAISGAISSFQTAQASLERLAEVEMLEREADSVALTTGPDEELVPGLVAAQAPGSQAREGADARHQGGTALRGARLIYPGGSHPALRSLDLEVPDTGITAVVGPSGSGKSSVLRVLCGFYPLQRGTCEVGGRALPEWDVSLLRQHVAYVEQESPILEGTIRSNLLYGNPAADDLDDEAIWEVLRDVQLADRITDLDDPVGYRGGNLSGGERQRLALARGLLRRPSLLLLDECTSALDITTEKRVIAALRERARTLPMLMVAHRLESVRGADHIAVLADGRLNGFGTHEELLVGNDLYRGLVRSSEGSEDSGDTEPAGAEPAPVP